MTRRFAAFCVVGTVGFLVDAGLLGLLLWLTAAGPLTGRAVSFLMAVLVTWQLNRRLTFAVGEPAGPRAALQEFARYLAASSVGIAVNLGLYALLVLHVDMFSAMPPLAVALGSVCALAVNFVLSSYWVFR